MMIGRVGRSFPDSVLLARLVVTIDTDLIIIFIWGMDG